MGDRDKKTQATKEILFNFTISLKEAVANNDVKGILTYKSNIANQEKEVIALETGTPTNGPISVMQPLLERGTPNIYGFTPYTRTLVNGKFA